ncbi:hypothetical protein AURDEDRAFT_178440, partial [Auricularia subglabra TFB-10046 SS5]
MAQRVRAALDALRTLEYTPRQLLLDLLASEDEFSAPERAQIVAGRAEIIGRLLSDSTAPKAHDALAILDALHYPPLSL